MFLDDKNIFELVYISITIKLLSPKIQHWCIFLKYIFLNINKKILKKSYCIFKC
jgi:hypothetical protein